MAGRQQGSNDVRDMIPEFIRAVSEIKPKAFVMENVAALGSNKFGDYVEDNVCNPLKGLGYHFRSFEIKAEDYGVPQIRKRLFFIGFISKEAFNNYEKPAKTHSANRFYNENQNSLLASHLPSTMGVREALGLPDIGFDSLAPTIRSGLTGPRQTTSILSSVSALKKWYNLGIWPNGVSATRLDAQAFPAKHDHYRLSIEDVAIMQGFPEKWNFGKAVYLAIGQIGNSVAPPMAYQIALSVKKAILR